METDSPSASLSSSETPLVKATVSCVVTPSASVNVASYSPLTASALVPAYEVPLSLTVKVKSRLRSPRLPATSFSIVIPPSW